MKSIRQEFVESVVNDNTMSLVRRYVGLKRKLKRPGKYGNFSVRCQHASIMLAELTRRIKAR